MTQDRDDDAQWTSTDDFETSRRDFERGWEELLAEAVGWPVLRLE